MILPLTAEKRINITLYRLIWIRIFEGAKSNVVSVEIPKDGALPDGTKPSPSPSVSPSTSPGKDPLVPTSTGYEAYAIARKHQ